MRVYLDGCPIAEVRRGDDGFYYREVSPPIYIALGSDGSWGNAGYNRDNMVRVDERKPMAEATIVARRAVSESMRPMQLRAELIYGR